VQVIFSIKSQKDLAALDCPRATGFAIQNRLSRPASVREAVEVPGSDGVLCIVVAECFVYFVVETTKRVRVTRVMTDDSLLAETRDADARVS